MTYADAGVNIDRGNRTKQRIKYLAHKTFTKGVLSEIGGFGGLYSVDKKYLDPVLVSSVDGVGTKLKVAFEMNLHHTVGADLVNHCVNDIAVQGAAPLFFMDYLATGTLEPEVAEKIVGGLAEACKHNGCALIGGETAEMPGFYPKGEYDLAGFIVGVVEREKIINGKDVQIGDCVLGLPSNGLHTNGYSLARKIFFEQMKLKPTSRVAELRNTIGDELLKVHITYGPLIQTVLKRFNPQPSTLNHQLALKGLAHITGGGFVDNIPRILPKNCDVLIRKGSWDMLPIFEIIRAQGRVPEAELYQVFNMGIGMTLIVAADRADSILKFIRTQNQKAWLIGEVVKGRGEARVE